MIGFVLCCLHSPQVVVLRVVLKVNRMACNHACCCYLKDDKTAKKVQGPCTSLGFRFLRFRCHHGCNQNDMTFPFSGLLTLWNILDHTFVLTRAAQREGGLEERFGTLEGGRESAPFVKHWEVSQYLPLQALAHRSSLPKQSFRGK